MKFIVFFLIFSNAFFVNAYVDVVIPDEKFALDLNLFEDALDPELCDRQMRYIVRNDLELLLLFLDSGIRTPRGILNANTLDLGNYYQCLGINKEVPDMVVEGKYCLINIPLQQNISWSDSQLFANFAEWSDIPWPEIPWQELNRNTSKLSDKLLSRLEQYNLRKAGANSFFGGKVDSRLSRVSPESPLAALSFNLAICIPKVCSTENALRTFVNMSRIGMQYHERLCRLPDDKSWLAGDYVAVSIFAIFAFLAILSTAYDLSHNIFLEKDPKTINKLYASFSVYTNTRRLVTYTPTPGALECLDGIRVFAMTWVLIGHTFVIQMSSGLVVNPLDVFEWVTSLRAVLITAAPITVDTFFLMSGLLLVYTTYGKLSPKKLLKNLHLFYLNRLLRMFPLLAAVILIQISVLNWVVDGPAWDINMIHTHKCRVYWWSTLLYIQNYVNPSGMCLDHSWYLAIDVQLHIMSPIVLVWILTGRKFIAWTAMLGSLITVMTAATIYSFIMNFPPGPILPYRSPEDNTYYSLYYYVNTLTRASPFLIGLIVGYLLSIYREQKIALSKIFAAVLWLCSATIICLTLYASYPIIQMDWDNQFADNMINSFMKPGWAMAVGWLIFACVQGYGGPINWILSLRAWKLLARISYAMYLTHYPLIFVINAMRLQPLSFRMSEMLLQFLVEFSLTVLVSFFLTILVDSPCSVLIKHFMGSGIKKSSEAVVIEESENKTKQEDRPTPSAM